MDPFVDLRSDTVTRPTRAMKQAMMDAPLGDDVFGDDPTVHALERKVAQLLGKEAAILVPSGTMANQLALRVQLRPGEEAIVHAGCHILNNEGGGAAALSGVTLRPLDSADGGLDPGAVEANLHLDDDPHHAQTRLICLENTHNACGGQVLSFPGLQAVAEVARRHGVAMHLDGARLLNAQVASGRAAQQWAALFDTVSLCLSKGLGAPVGSVLAGPADLVAKARRHRKQLGGGMRQAGILAAAGLYALDHHVERLADDHRRARQLAEAIAQVPGLTVELWRVQTNIVYFDLAPDHPLARDPRGRETLQRRLAERGVRIAGAPYRLRAVTHLDVDDTGIERACAALREVMR